MSKCNHRYQQIKYGIRIYICTECGNIAKPMTVGELLERTKNLPTTLKK
ncbi:hypothetical protein [Paraclostridium dentum]|nr:hypothetical protein [Paraclostridium dentum]